MKRFFISFTLALLAAASLEAQTPNEIIARMDAEMAKSQQTGMAVTMDLQIPIIGTASTRMYFRGDKNRSEMTFKGETHTIWMDNTTSWAYSPKENEVVIENRKSSASDSNEENLDLFKGITDGYDVTLKSETADAWYFACKKSKTNTDKDDPKNMDLIVAKASYLPIELSTKAKGIKISMKNVVMGVSEADVTFDISKLPGVKVTDKR